MKTILTTLVTVVVGLVALPDTAEARPQCNTGHSSYTYASGRASCGCTTYIKRVFVGYDCHRHPVYRYYKVPVVHRCNHSRSHYRPHPRRQSSHYYNHNSRYGCRSSHGNHISLRTRFGNVSIRR